MVSQVVEWVVGWKRCQSCNCLEARDDTKGRQFGDHTLKTLDLEISIESIIDSMTDEQKSKWEELNGVELSLALGDVDTVSLLASLLEVLV